MAVATHCLLVCPRQWYQILANTQEGSSAASMSVSERVVFHSHTYSKSVNIGMRPNAFDRDKRKLTYMLAHSFCSPTCSARTCKTGRILKK